MFDPILTPGARSTLLRGSNGEGAPACEALCRYPSACTHMVPSRRIERAGNGLFEGEEAVAHLIERIVGPLGLRVDESSPWADARLPEGIGSTRSSAHEIARWKVLMRHHMRAPARHVSTSESVAQPVIGSSRTSGSPQMTLQSASESYHPVPAQHLHNNSAAVEPYGQLTPAASSMTWAEAPRPAPRRPAHEPGYRRRP